MVFLFRKRFAGKGVHGLNYQADFVIIFNAEETQNEGKGASL